MIESLEPRLPLSADFELTEFLASNDNGLRDGDGNDSDWVEIHNTAGVTRDLDGWYLTDDPNQLEKWAFPDITLVDDQYLVVFASAPEDASGVVLDDYVDAQGNLHTNFKLSSKRGYLALVDDTGVSPVVATEFGSSTENYLTQTTNVSYGVIGTALRFFPVPTPGGANGTGFVGITAEPEFDPPRGFYDNGVTITITTATPGAQVYYTIDGSFPSETNGTLYSSPISINTSTPLRAVTIKTEFATVAAETATYFVGESEPTKSLPVISLVADPNGTFSVENGLFKDLHVRGREGEFR